MNRISSCRLLTTTWVRLQCSQNISWVSKGKGLFGPNGGSGRKFEGGFGGKVGSFGGNGRRGGSIARIGRGLLAKRSMELNDGLGGGRVYYCSGEEFLDGWVCADRGEVKGGGVDFGVSKSLLGEIPSDIMEESKGEAFRVDGGAD
ncbi:hypothetical protein Tco_1324382 [Tanacetum coccineum]